MITREITKNIRSIQNKMPVISITGPRQSGKTTLSKAIFPDYKYVNLENPENRDFANNDPKAFINQAKNGLIIDEAQYCPELFSYIQVYVDENKEMGKIIITGSQNFLLLEKISQSLAGRVAIFYLLPFSFTELQSIVSENLLSQQLIGGYPPVHDREIDPSLWFPSYINTYVERDVRQIINIKDLGKFQLFIKLLAARASQIMNITSFCNQAGIDTKTFHSWLGVLKASFIIFDVQAFHKNFNKRIIKSPKFYFIDTGLLCYLLDIRNVDHLNNHPLKGEIFENFVMAELFKYNNNQLINARLFYWRDSNGIEIDCILEQGLDVKAIEIKSSSTIHESFFKNLKYWQKISNISPEKSFIIYGGNENQSRSTASVKSWMNLYSVFNE